MRSLLTLPWPGGRTGGAAVRGTTRRGGSGWRTAASCQRQGGDERPADLIDVVTTRIAHVGVRILLKQEWREFNAALPDLLEAGKASRSRVRAKAVRG